MSIFPVICGSAFKNKGVQLLLDAVVDYLPSPLDIPPVTGVNAKGEEIVRTTSDSEPFAAVAFKIMTDPFVGQLTFIRVYSGTLNSGSYVYNSTKGQRERVGRLLKMHANKREEIDRSIPATSAPPWGSRARSPGIPSAMRTSPLSWRP